MNYTRNAKLQSSTGQQKVVLEVWGVDGPNSASIEITSKCNLKCTMCPLTLATSSTSGAVTHLTLPLWEKFLKGLEQDISRVLLTGFGEPMLHPHLLRFLGDLQERSLLTSLTTNGVRTTPAFLAAMPDLTYLDHLNVSIDSFDPDVYEAIRKGKLGKCLDTISKYAKARGPRTTLSVSSILMQSTLPSLKEAPRKLADLGVGHLVLQSLFDQAPEGLDQHLSGEQLAEQIAEIQHQGAQAGVEVHFELPDRLQLELHDPAAANRNYFDDSRTHGQSRVCGLAWDTTHVDAAGKVFPCCRAAAVDQGALGDLGKASFAEIWQGQPYQALRSSFGQADRLSDLCATCTTVPAGLHVHAGFEGRVEPVIDQADDGTLTLYVTNCGTRDWDAEYRPSIGTARPNDRESPLYNKSWISRNRVARMHEGRVSPGGRARFTLPVNVSDGEAAKEHFQLVIDGMFWIPGTHFSLRWDVRADNIQH
ncbi:radical SAM protein [uncultured Sulfitobacter sp.]|uniref:radical SAM protein n=1 Tax=uncultured Sulfitobacter sp. TaxID=191468 RepID=UPI00260601D3|nr:radical SAM protein [uncultured Sulfitobacter sp.]